MNWKEFLKPDWRKILLFFVLFGISSLYSTPYYKVFANYGFPMQYFTFIPEENSFCDIEPCPNPGLTLSYVNLFINFIFWYLISCLVVHIYPKSKKKK